MKPLAYRMRPTKIEDIIGQQHLVAEDKIIGRMVQAKHLSSMMTAFSFRKAILVEPAIAVAIDVFPIPGGPYKIMDDKCFAWTILPIILSSATRCCWPASSIWWLKIKLLAEWSRQNICHP